MQATRLERVVEQGNIFHGRRRRSPHQEHRGLRGPPIIRITTTSLIGFQGQ
jgi:hypothetical protein